MTKLREIRLTMTNHDVDKRNLLKNLELKQMTTIRNTTQEEPGFTETSMIDTFITKANQ